MDGLNTSIICILLDIPCYENQNETKQITEYGNKALKDHRRMDTKCMEQYLM